ncbi:MAG: ADP-ribosylglycohydrolase [Phormidium sp. OSCR]|nr:MAG: ADP-ribosylglycohydrolase [Phormidium sp. OSCR]
MLTSINAGGDTDTIGAIVGGLCGAYHGSEAYQEFLPYLVELDFISLSDVNAIATLLSDQLIRSHQNICIQLATNAEICLLH